MAEFEAKEAKEEQEAEAKQVKKSLPREPLPEYVAVKRVFGYLARDGDKEGEE
jgi:hypothetical protein